MIKMIRLTIIKINKENNKYFLLVINLVEIPTKKKKPAPIARVIRLYKFSFSLL